ncbi:hypothetical protein CHLNCDRAFT_48733 [Chlorella variabilis]|uniref:Glutathione peroxidase n=1 Tax=Chlorella variabilis TaxID=554065 RepID=E1ZCY6_CHLVA|nr:hypothetical protein CHLNCDRAFT_48733 [Chlorella variabilis]EFN56130.1 hypothetical protein CHLNCDRAFT_48733 [Chlorella variabilis]|eukprot:XP_005848232.1 hypothetical protein CHLNCDRAFT_48733 [Chlorella variabilis]
MGNLVSFTTPKCEATNYHQLSALDIDKQPVDFSSLDGKVVLVVNEFTVLHEKYADQGLVIQAFPCNQFASQEPGSNEEIKQFAAAHGFKGLLMDKINVNGSCASPVYNFLKVASSDTSPIMWNFAKFIVKRDGTVAGRFGPRTSPCSLEPQLQECLNAAAP